MAGGGCIKGLINVGRAGETGYGIVASKTTGFALAACLDLDIIVSDHAAAPECAAVEGTHERGIAGEAGGAVFAALAGVVAGHAVQTLKIVVMFAQTGTLPHCEQSCGRTGQTGGWCVAGETGVIAGRANIDPNIIKLRDAVAEFADGVQGPM